MVLLIGHNQKKECALKRKVHKEASNPAEEEEGEEEKKMYEQIDFQVSVPECFKQVLSAECRVV